jgi:hypothetical protein
MQRTPLKPALFQTNATVADFFNSLRNGRAVPAPFRHAEGSWTCLIAVESSIVNKPTLLDWLRTAAQHYADWLRRTRLTVPSGDPAKRRPNLP